MTTRQHNDGDSTMLVGTVGKHILPLLIPVLVGIGSAAITTTITMARIEERISHLESIFSERSQTIEGFRTKNTEYERRISRMESLAENTQHRLNEIGTDVKALLRAERGSK